MLNEAPQARCMRLASRQHGAITRRQALKYGMTRNMIETCLRRGLWDLLYPSVYVPAGVTPSWETRVCGAVVGIGPPTAASHRTAARLLRIDGFTDDIVEVTTPTNVRWTGVRRHRGSPSVAQVQRVQGISTTTPAETLLGLGAVVGRDRVEGALDSALVRGLVSVDYMQRRLLESHRRPGLGTIRQLLVERTKQPPTESELERLYLRRVTRRFKLPAPRFQFEVPHAKPRRRIDFAYPSLMLGVEVLGWKQHGMKLAWQRDFERHNQLTALGWEILYFTWLDVAKHPARVAADVNAAINRRTCLFV